MEVVIAVLSYQPYLVLRSIRRRSGLTLIETLVVIAITSVLIGLLVGGVQKVRTAAARTQCQNTLRQIAIAGQSYHGSHTHFPLGVTPPNDTREPFPYMTWMVRLLPYLEQDTIWNETVQAFRTNPNFQIDPTHKHRGSVLRTYTCPSDTRVQSPAMFGGSHAYGLTSYLGVSGTNPVRADGCLLFGTPVRIADITDGTSNTLFVGERPPNDNLHFGWWYAGQGMLQDGDLDSVMGVRARCRRSDCYSDCGDEPWRFQPGQFDKKCSFLHFWSPHTGGANFAFADGSVRFLRYSADEILPALATRARGEVVTLPE